MFSINIIIKTSKWYKASYNVARLENLRRNETHDFKLIIRRLRKIIRHRRTRVQIRIMKQCLLTSKDAFMTRTDFELMTRCTSRSRLTLLLSKREIRSMRARRRESVSRMKTRRMIIDVIAWYCWIWRRAKRSCFTSLCCRVKQIEIYWVS